MLVPCVAGRWSSLILLVEQAERSIGPNSGLAEPQKFVCCRTRSHKSTPTVTSGARSGNVRTGHRIRKPPSIFSFVATHCGCSGVLCQELQFGLVVWWSKFVAWWSVVNSSGQWPKHSSPSPDNVPNVQLHTPHKPHLRTRNLACTNLINLNCW